MAKSNRTCYRRDWKEFWTPRPLTFYSSNKRNKSLCHRIERRVVKVEIIRDELKQYWYE